MYVTAQAGANQEELTSGQHWLVDCAIWPVSEGEQIRACNAIGRHVSMNAGMLDLKRSSISVTWRRFARFQLPIDGSMREHTSAYVPA